MMSNQITLGYDLDVWQGYWQKVPITVDISLETNSHILICGMSGSGKTYCELILFARIILANPNGECYFADYKGDNSFVFMRESSHYYPYKRTLEAVDIVYAKLQNRQAGVDKERHSVTLVIDEYISFILALQSEDKKKANQVMNMISEILMIGRSLGVRLFISCQRPDAIAFPSGSRLNYGIVMILGAPISSIYEMLMPEFAEKMKGRSFGRGEGTLLLQGSELHFVKVPMIKDLDRLQELCKEALS